MLQQWWRLGGVLGIGFVVLFIVGIVIQGESPSRDDSIEDIRAYFSDDGTMYLVGDYLLGLAFLFGFLPFLVTLRWVQGAAEGDPPIWSWAMFGAGLVTLVVGGVAGTFWGALAVGAADNPEISDSAVRTLMELDVYAFGTLGLAMGAFALFGGIVMYRTGIPWRWLGGVAILAGVLMVISSAWPIDGDEEGALAVPGFIGGILLAIWILATSIGLVMRQEDPRPAR